MNEAQMAAARALVGAARLHGGPWAVIGRSVATTSPLPGDVDPGDGPGTEYEIPLFRPYGSATEDDVRFLLGARTLLPAALDALERLTEETRLYRKLIELIILWRAGGGPTAPADAVRWLDALVSLRSEELEHVGT